MKFEVEEKNKTKAIKVKSDDKNSTNVEETETKPKKTTKGGSFMQKITEDLAASSIAILGTCGVAIVFSFILLTLFRYAIKYVVWVIYIGVVLLFIIGALIFVVISVETEAPALLIVSAVLGIIGIILAVVLCVCKKQIKLVVEMYKETSKVLMDAPALMFEPVLTFIMLIGGSIAFIYFYLVIESSGHLKVQHDLMGDFDKAVYVKNTALNAAYFMNIVGYAWFTSLIFGCQHFITACTVCQWYFTRSKEKLESPVIRSFSFLLRFHIGSVSFGALIMTAIMVIRMILESIKVNLNIFKNLFEF